MLKHAVSIAPARITLRYSRHHAVMCRVKGTRAGRMATVTTETDLETRLAAMADRLRVFASALRGMARDRGDVGPEERAQLSLAGELDAAGRELDIVAGSLCRRCGLLEVHEQLRFGGTPRG